MLERDGRTGSGSMQEATRLPSEGGKAVRDDPQLSGLMKCVNCGPFAKMERRKRQEFFVCFMGDSWQVIKSSVCGCAKFEIPVR